MSIKTLRILIYGMLGFLILLIGTGIYQRHYSSEVEMYAEIQHSFYNVSNQCIAEYYVDELTTDGRIMSFYSILEDCKATYISEGIVKIYDTDGKQQTSVKAYQLHGIMIKLNANACFMDKVVLRRVDNGKVVQDITDDFRENHPDNIIESSSDLFI